MRILDEKVIKPNEEMTKLRNLLDVAGIEWWEMSDGLFCRTHIMLDDDERISIVWGDYSYGGDEGLLEMRDPCGGVIGGMTARETFERINKIRRREIAMNYYYIDRDITNIIEEELKYANKEHPLFNSHHEAESVIREEVQESVEALERLVNAYDEIWQSIRSDGMATSFEYLDLKEEARRAIKELVQVAAMCEKALMSEELWKEE